jgi:branched-chain amino acid transport system ATP-binding protein
MLTVKSITAGYGDLEVLHEVSLEVRRSEIVTIVGANGAGKTTVINAVCGQVVCSAGSMRFLDQRIDTVPAHRRVALGLVQVPEGRRLFAFMSVRENLELGCYTERARREREASFERVLSLFPILKSRLRQLAGTLSGGEQQMLAIGRSLMALPSLLIMDEPTLGLAPRMVAQVFDIVRTLNGQGITLLLVEQNVRHALELAHRGYVLENGRVVLEGAGKELLADARLKQAYLGL